MKLGRTILGVAMLLIMVTACGEKVVNNEIVVPVPGTSLVRFTVSAPEYATRAQADPSLQEDEGRVFNYTILIFDSHRRLEAVLSESPYDPNTAGSTGIDYQEALTFRDEKGDEIELELTSGIKYVFAQVNAPVPVSDDLVRYMEDEDLSCSRLADWSLDLGETGLGLITGRTAIPEGDERGFMMTSADGFETVYLDPGDETVTVVELSAGRAMAKVSVTSDLKENPRNREQQPHGELTGIEYKLINNPREMYIVPRIENGTLITPYYNHSAAVSGLYFDSPAGTPDNYTPLCRENAVTCLCGVENANAVPTSENSSTAVIRGTYTPDLFYCADGQSFYTGYLTGDDFWRIATVEDGRRTGYGDKYYGEDPAALLQAGEESVKYGGGVTYYPVLLTNAEDEHPCSVKRNSYYNVRITGVKGAGEESEPGEPVDPQPPFPDDAAAIGISITIGDWNMIDQQGNLR